MTFLKQNKVNQILLTQCMNYSNKFRPIHFTGMIEDQLFKESRQILNLLREQNDFDIQGQTYQEICKDIERKQYLQKIRQNIPKYYCLKPTHRQNHFQQVSQIYLQKLGLETQQKNNEQLLQTPTKKSKNQRQALSIKSRQLTPIKSKLISKKQIKKPRKSLNLSNYDPLIQENKTQVVPDILNQIKNVDQQMKQQSNQKIANQQCQTPKKKKNSVRFFQYQYVKDFSHKKTPNKISQLEQFMQPLKFQKQVNQN